jgi:cell volume regulation protein A
MYSIIPLEYLLAGASLLLLISIFASKASSTFGIPALLLFLLIGMLAGSEGVGGIYFNDPRLAQYIGVVALVCILFAGGLETEWKSVRPVVRQGIALSTIGVLLTAALLGGFVVVALKFTLLEGLLLGAIVSSTDAAAVFAVLRSKKISLKGELRPLLEFESGSNDPMAVLLTIGLTGLLVGSHASLAALLPLFVLQMAIGGAAGYLLGNGIVRVINRIRLAYDGLYPVLTVAAMLLVYALTTILQGNGFLAIYVAGIIIGNSSIVQKRYLIHFHSALAWLMQIAMFLALGLLVFPSRLAPAAGTGLLIAAVLMFVARPASVFLTLLPTRFSLREKLLIAWVGLRGSVPIILATYPLLAGVQQAPVIFNIVFFIVLVSTLLQGTTIPLVAKLLGVEAPLKDGKRYPLEMEMTDALNTQLIDFMVPFGSWMAGKTISEIGLPPDSLVTLIARNEDFIVPNGQTAVEQGDVLLTLVNNDNLQVVRGLFAQQAP